MSCKTQLTTPENIEEVRELIEGDLRLTVVEICQELGLSCGNVQSIIKNAVSKNFGPMGTQAVE